MTWVWLIPLLPLLGAVLAAVLGPRVIPRQCHLLVIAGVAVAALLSVILLFQVDADQTLDITGYEWIIFNNGALKNLIHASVDSFREAGSGGGSDGCVRYPG